MKNKSIKIVILSVIAILALTLFAACGEGETEKKYDYLITFNYNVGNLGDKDLFKDQYLGVKEGGTVALKPGDNDSFKEIALNGYFIEGWYTAKTDEDGNPIEGDDGRVVLDDVWDFGNNTITEDITLYANFVKKCTLIIKGGDTELRYDEKPGAIKRQPSVALQPKKEGYTFFGYFTDATYTTEFKWPFEYVPGETVVYAQFVEGDWAVVSTAKEFVSAIQGNKNIYLNADIDFTDEKWASLPYNGEINGNKHTISGIKTTLEFSKKNSSNLALFGTLGAKAYLHDFTISNAQVEMKWAMIARDDNCKIGLLAWGAEEGCRIANVTVSGTLKVNYDSLINSYEGSEISVEEIDVVIAKGRGNANITNCNFDDITIIE